MSVAAIVEILWRCEHKNRGVGSDSLRMGRIQELLVTLTLTLAGMQGLW
jgi:hypothetical protein